jgi:uncharacterized protein YdaU (DUF1376 family)
MPLLELIPAIVIHALLGISIIIAIGVKYLKFAPILKYKLVLKPFAYLFLLMAVWMSGFNSHKQMTDNKLRELELKLQIAEEKANTVNTEIKYVIRNRVRRIKDVQIQVQEKIKEVQVEIDGKCELDPSVIQIHNQSATNRLNDQ